MSKTLTEIEAKPFNDDDVDKFMDALTIDDPISEAIAWVVDDAHAPNGNANAWRIANEANAQAAALRAAERERDALKEAIEKAIKRLDEAENWADVGNAKTDLSYDLFKINEGRITEGNNILDTQRTNL